MRLWRGGAFALASATCFGAGAPAAKLFVTQIDPWLMAGLLYAGAGTGLSVFWLARRLSGWRIARGAPLSGRGWWWFFGAAIAGGGFAPVLLMLGLARTPASTSSLLINLEVVLTVLIAAVVFGERIRGAARLGILAVILGGVILAWQGEFAFADPLGPLLVAGACLGWALDNNLTREIAHCDPAQIAVLRGLLAGALNVGLALLSGAAMPDAWLILGAGMLGLFSYGVPLVFFVLALRELGTSRTGTVFATAPFIGAIVSILALGEPADPRLGIAGACMALGLWLMLGGRLRRGAVEPGTSR
jgi:drug/metabolite transporter (DMT)-like permease